MSGSTRTWSCFLFYLYSLTYIHLKTSVKGSSRNKWKELTNFQNACTSCQQLTDMRWSKVCLFVCTKVHQSAGALERANNKCCVEPLKVANYVTNCCTIYKTKKPNLQQHLRNKNFCTERGISSHVCMFALCIMQEMRQGRDNATDDDDFWCRRHKWIIMLLQSYAYQDETEFKGIVFWNNCSRFLANVCWFFGFLVCGDGRGSKMVSFNLSQIYLFSFSIYYFFIQLSFYFILNVKFVLIFLILFYFFLFGFYIYYILFHLNSLHYYFKFIIFCTIFLFTIF